MKINEISKEIHQNNIDKGFWEDKETKNVGELLKIGRASCRERV